MNRGALLKDLQRQVKALTEDLRERAATPEFDSGLHKEWQIAQEASRQDISYERWLEEDQLPQAAVAWTLATVFIRFCEDNQLIAEPYISGPGSALERATDRQLAFFGENPTLTDRDWIIEAAHAMSRDSKVVAGLFNEHHNPMWRITPSHDAAKALLSFWRTTTGSEGTLQYDFTDPTWDTRFLGDLYQELSEHAKKTYALLQTPEFVEEFILDLTLTPALDEFGLEPEYPGPRANMPKGLRLIDPTCGSGHFLLGAFHRLLAAWKDKAPGMEAWERVRKALYSVHGVDKNPFAVEIARFRLMLAALRAAGETNLKNARDFDLNIAVGDSLIHGRGAAQPPKEMAGLNEPHTFACEDIYDQRFVENDVLGAGSYHVVVGNPPYITVKDKQENTNYRKIYNDVCSGKYALSVPFAARLFELGARGDNDGLGAGYVGQITANSFMKREFGKNLIELHLTQKVHLTHIIDTSGAYIPGHGTPTVILVGNNHFPRPGSIRTVLGIQGEPKQPQDPADGLAWKAISEQVYRPGSESTWVSVSDLPRERFAIHPWSLSGGGADELISRIESHTRKLSSKLSRAIGFASFPGQDEAFFVGSPWLKRHGITFPMSRPLIVGEVVRDWDTHHSQDALVPYDHEHQSVPLDASSTWAHHLWTMRRVLDSTKSFEGQTLSDMNGPWWTWYRWIPERYITPLSITFAFVATHNHFALDRGGKVFKQSAPVIKLPQDATEAHHLELLGLLNSSVACFWLKQVSQSKGNGGIGGGISNELWEHRYEFTGTKLQELPLSPKLPRQLGQDLDSLALALSTTEPSAVCQQIPTRTNLDKAKLTHSKLRARMIAHQEELDWEVYSLYGLVAEAESDSLKSTDLDSIPEIKLGERAFEIVLARKIAAGEATTAWFERHRSTPVTEIPSHWPQWYRDLVQRRIDIIEKHRDIALIERPEFKRRWSSDPWEKKEAAALRTWLLDACERRDLWFAPDHNGYEQPISQTINRLADRLRADPDFVSVVRLYAGTDADIATVLTAILSNEHVPYLAALRYKDSGLRKRAQWESTWELQREEDRTGKNLKIPVPPKYGSGDFLKTSYWQQRGKLDVPKERFISYPDASPAADGSLLLGWAGWDHRQMAYALITLIEERSGDWAETPERLTPLLAGLAEVMPWVRQWHDEIDPMFGTSPAADYSTYLANKQLELGLPDEALQSWRPTPRARSRKKN